MNSLLNTKSRYPIFIIAVVIIVMVVSPFVETYLNNAVKNVRPLADTLMYNLKNQHFEKINNLLDKDINLKQLASGSNIINSYKEVGYGVDASDDIWISYYVTGLPAETRNISINFIKKGEQWFIKDIIPSYEISRVHKKNIFLFIDEIISNDYISAHELFKNKINADKFESIKEFINQNSNKIKDWKITKAKNFPTQHLPNQIPSETEFFVKSINNNKISLYFLCKELKDEYWIDKVEIVN
jgi:hypothetical protein